MQKAARNCTAWHDNWHAKLQVLKGQHKHPALRGDTAGGSTWRREARRQDAQSGLRGKLGTDQKGWLFSKGVRQTHLSRSTAVFRLSWDGSDTAAASAFLEVPDTAATSMSTGTPVQCSDLITLGSHLFSMLCTPCQCCHLIP